MSDLVSRQCSPCEGGVEPLHADQVFRYLRQLPGWAANEAMDTISKRFQFADFHETMAFINAKAWVSHQQDHHPDFSAGYHHCEVRYTTHAIDGLSENDFICAAKIEALLSP